MSKTDVVNELRKYNIKASRYKKAPVGKHVFFMSTDPKTPEKEIRIHEAGAEATVIDGDANLKQAVLNVYEEKHKIQRKARLVRPKTNKISVGTSLRAQDFGINLPRGSRIKAVEAKVVQRNLGQIVYDVLMEATVPSSIQTFLVGMDESAQFISALPRSNIKSVEEAHKVLKPRNLDKKAKRQGEWFFEPVEEGELSQAQIVKLWRGLRFRQLEGSSFHSGTICSIKINGKNTTFAIGVIRDSRRDRHEPLMLTDWHRVRRNRERVIRNSSQRGWD